MPTPFFHILYASGFRDIGLQQVTICLRDRITGLPGANVEGWHLSDSGAFEVSSWSIEHNEV